MRGLCISFESRKIGRPEYEKRLIRNVWKYCFCLALGYSCEWQAEVWLQNWGLNQIHDISGFVSQANECIRVCVCVCVCVFLASTSHSYGFFSSWFLPLALKAV